jgi:hypothetical protein
MKWPPCPAGLLRRVASAAAVGEAGVIGSFGRTWGFFTLSHQEKDKGTRKTESTTSAPAKEGATMGRVTMSVKSHGDAYPAGGYRSDSRAMPVRVIRETGTQLDRS